ncbi:hypothetical protein [Photobacterium aquae]|uniref:hypothetical protein n=1 Tax=Photobacterium aquae TaxID=1195763 RepID=UPI000A7C634E|nr:hypothetical protein [Photobacterium aquae]
MNSLLKGLGGLVLLLLVGCEPVSRGNTASFTLPPGDAKRGEALFLKYQCLSCHSLEGFERPVKSMSQALMSPSEGGYLN